MSKKILLSVMDHIFFNRYRATILCISFMFISFIVEISSDLNGFFSSSGTLFTVAGLFLNIKLTALFHRKQKNIDTGEEEPLSIMAKYDLTVQSFRFADEVPEQEKERVIKNIESDEICGVLLMIFGTALWGYGSYFIAYFKCA